MDKNDFIAKLPVFFGTVVGGLTLLLITFSFGSNLLDGPGKPAEFYLSQPAGGTCTIGIKSLTPEFKCGTDCSYRVTYICQDNFKSQMDVSQAKLGGACQKLSAWRKMVEPVCAKHPYCPSPLPSPTPRPSSTP